MLKPTLNERFDEYDRANPHVYNMFCDFAMQVINKVRTKISSKFIFERMRWEVLMNTNDPEGFKLNNNYTAFYARKFIDQYPQYSGLFSTRSSLADNT